MIKTKIAMLAAAALLALNVAGCGANWLANFKSNPVAVVQQEEQTAQVIINDAQTAWPFVKGLIPSANQAQAQTDFNNAVFAANHALVVLNDAIQVALDAQTPNPDFSAAMQSVTDAVSQVINIINQFKNSAAPQLKLEAPGTPDVFADMNTGVATLRKISKK